MDKNDSILITVLCVISMAVGCFIGYITTRDYYRITALKQNCAEYNSKTGSFQWIDMDTIKIKKE